MRRGGAASLRLGAAMAWFVSATPLELPLELWQTGADPGESELPGFRQIVDAIAVAQNPASCEGARFAVLSNANAGVGCVMHRIASEIALAWEQGRIAVWNPAETAWTDDPWCKAGGDGNGWSCLFNPLSRCALPDGVAPAAPATSSWASPVVSAGTPVARTHPTFFASSHTGPFSGLVPPKVRSTHTSLTLSTHPRLTLSTHPIDSPCRLTRRQRPSCRPSRVMLCKTRATTARGSPAPWHLR